VRAELAVVESVTGERPSTCPWAAFLDPDVADVVRAYDWHESGQCAEWWGPEPEWWIVEGVRVYHRALGRVRADAIKIEGERKKRAAPRLPPGAVVEHSIRA